MSPPLVFISHKHTDTDIAQVVAKFIRDLSLGNVAVYLSSNWNFAGPRFGSGLNAELMNALWKSDVLILIYTSADQDWSYCMWECGVATQRDSPDTRIIVFQCGVDVPTPFSADLRVDVRNPEHVRRFMKQLLTDPNFFMGRGGALAPNAVQATIEKAAEDFYGELKKVIPPDPDGQVNEWSSWPFLRVQLPEREVARLMQASAADRVKLAREVVNEHGVIIKSDFRAAQLFGMGSFPDKYKFKELLAVWADKFPNADATWFNSCCEQIMVGARREFPVIRWTALKQIGGDSEFTPVLNRVKRVLFAGTIHFDLYFYNLSDPRGVPVTSQMIPKSEFFYKKLKDCLPESLKLRDIVGELKEQKLNRVPILSDQDAPLYVVHRSMIDKFVAENMWANSGSNPDSYTLADLLADPEMKAMFENTFAVISKNSTLAEAKSAISTTPLCSDVFVTENGRRDEPVIGWLTNVDIARSS